MQKTSGIPNFESGRVLLSTGDLPVLLVNLTNNQINVDVEDKAFIKRIIAMRGQLSQKQSKEPTGKKPKTNSPLSILRTVAETLRDQGITVTVSYKGRRMLTIGTNAKPILLQLVTKTRGVAINSVFTAIKMII